MKICCIADLHGKLPEVPECDVLVIAGDICGGVDPVREAFWLDVGFRDWLAGQEAEVIGIAGNHDLIFERDKDMVPGGLGWNYLENSGVEIGGVKFYGHPYTRRFRDWAFNRDTEGLGVINGLIPDDVDVLITHGPPYGILDTVDGVYAMDGGRRPRLEHLGDRTLRDAVLAVGPRYHIFGHIHSGHGTKTIGETTYVNASILDEDYCLGYKIQVVEI